MSQMCKKKHGNDNKEFIFLFAQLNKDLLTIQNDFYKFWHHSLQDIDKNKNDTIYFSFLYFS